MKQKVRAGYVVLISALSASACKSAPSQESAVASAAPSASAPRVIRPEDLPEELRAPTSWPIPTGPKLAILAGQGLGPIRLGATIATIERLMDSPCETKTDETCRYVGRATEFFLKDGVVVEMRTHRPGRPTTPKPRVFGVFNGRTPDGVAFLMLRDAVKGLIGAPLRVEPVAEGGDAQTVEVQVYDGMRIEFDKLPNGNVVVGGITIVKSDKAAAGKPAAQKKK